MGAALYDVYFLNPSQGWIVGDRGTILRTADGGVTWEDQSSSTAVDLFGVQFIDAKNGGRSVRSERFSSRNDGGQNWIQQTTDSATTFFDLYFTDPEGGWVVGSQGAIFQNDHQWRKMG